MLDIAAVLVLLGSRINRHATSSRSDDPICAQVCPADAIKQTSDGVVQSSLKPRCIGCSNCVLACPFGVPRYDAGVDQMMKCDMQAIAINRLAGIDYPRWALRDDAPRP